MKRLIGEDCEGSATNAAATRDKWRRGRQDGGWEGDEEVGTVGGGSEDGSEEAGPPEGSEGQRRGEGDAAGRRGQRQNAGGDGGGEDGRQRHCARTVEVALGEDATGRARTPARRSRTRAGTVGSQISVSRGDGEEKQTGTRVLGGLNWLGSRDPGSRLPFL
ncbi:hypothetical protein Syun_030770 [Stephania yunnanensis]|uniref:Uncharacterized protein n=1 Tax=Stephania yunnanensis TaxID=152371 RepID=A0AAP0DVB4_9MAGN